MEALLIYLGECIEFLMVTPPWNVLAGIIIFLTLLLKPEMEG